jgi:hypothetical protein
MKDFVLVRQMLGLFHTRIGRLDKDGEAIKEDREPRTEIAISSIVEHRCTISNTTESLKANSAIQVRGQYHVLLPVFWATASVLESTDSGKKKAGPD